MNKIIVTFKDGHVKKFSKAVFLNNQGVIYKEGAVIINHSKGKTIIPLSDISIVEDET